VVTRTTYIGRHRFNTKFWKTRERKPDTEVVEMTVPPIIDAAEFEAVQALLKSRSRRWTAPAYYQRPNSPHGHLLLRRLRHGHGRFRTGKERPLSLLHLLDQGPPGRDRLQGRTVPRWTGSTPWSRDHIERRLLQPARLEEILSSVLDRREERAERRATHVAELRKRAAETDAKLKRLYDAIENGVAISPTRC